MFKVGDTVTWESSAAGTTKTKAGKIVAEIPPGTSPVDVIRRLRSAHTFASQWGGGASRPTESYAVLVESDGRMRSKLYIPRTSALRTL